MANAGFIGRGGESVWGKARLHPSSGLAGHASVLMPSSSLILGMPVHSFTDNSTMRPQSRLKDEFPLGGTAHSAQGAT